MKVVASLVACLLVVCLLAPMTAEAKAPAVTQAQKNAVAKVFDADFYYNTYPDVAEAFGNNKTNLMNHYITNGAKEGRSASASFNAMAYRNRYPDLDAAYGNNMLKYVEHYVNNGIKEGRDASSEAATVAYAPEGGAAATSPTGTLLTSYTTKYSMKQSRAINIGLAASQVNGKVLAPGETFSYLSCLTPRTIENGYVVAPVFSGGKHSTGVGGGICQVSSTIYAAVMNTGVTVVERHAHSLPVTYVPKGMDATVSAPNLDLRFTNTFNQNMYFEVIADNGTLTVNVYLQ